MFILFAGDYYYPEGGWNDIVGVFDNIEDAKNCALAGNREFKRDYQWWHIVDMAVRKIVDGSWINDQTDISNL